MIPAARTPSPLHYRLSCERHSKWYASLEDARVQLTIICRDYALRENQTWKDLTPYECPYWEIGRHWHIGHDRTGKLAAS